MKLIIIFLTFFISINLYSAQESWLKLDVETEQADKLSICLNKNLYTIRSLSFVSNGVSISFDPAIFSEVQMLDLRGVRIIRSEGVNGENVYSSRNIAIPIIREGESISNYKNILEILFENGKPVRWSINQKGVSGDSVRKAVEFKNKDFEIR